MLSMAMAAVAAAAPSNRQPAADSTGLLLLRAYASVCCLLSHLRLGTAADFCLGAGSMESSLCVQDCCIPRTCIGTAGTCLGNIAVEHAVSNQADTSAVCWLASHVHSICAVYVKSDSCSDGQDGMCAFPPSLWLHTSSSIFLPSSPTTTHVCLPVAATSPRQPQYKPACGASGSGSRLLVFLVSLVSS